MVRQYKLAELSKMNWIILATAPQYLLKQVVQERNETPPEPLYFPRQQLQLHYVRRSVKWPPFPAETDCEMLIHATRSAAAATKVNWILSPFMRIRIVLTRLKKLREI